MRLAFPKPLHFLQDGRRQSRARTPLALMIAVALLVVTNITTASAQASVQAVVQSAQHKLAIQVDENNPATMNLALNNAQNVIEHYAAKNETVDVHVVTFGPGLHMLRTDTSPVKARIAELSLAHANLHFAVCENTRAKMSKAESKEIPIIAEGTSVPSGVVTLMELQAKGYAYIRP